MSASDDHEMVVSRRQVLTASAGLFLAAGIAEAAQRPVKIHGGLTPVKPPVNRVINIMNFLRAEEPRGPVDLMLPLREQMALIKRYRFPATWLLQTNALVEGPFVPFLKAGMPEHHEAGLWLEMDRKLCDAAGVAWRGNKDWGWDFHVPVAYLIGYTPAERLCLADAAVGIFKGVWGFAPKTVAAWNLDAITLDHLSKHYGTEAFGVCRDQIATDGYTIWGAPLGGYFPSRKNAWSPALDPSDQIDTPVFRLLGQDPVYYYDRLYPLPDGSISDEPDTMEPIWSSGRTDSFVHEFLRMTASAPCLSFAYAQLGQENSFGWPDTSKGYQIQMAELARLRDSGELSVETMKETGSRFRRLFSVTPAQSQVQLTDPFGHRDPAERSIWYQSRFYRANLHCRGEEFYLRDLTVYSDLLPQPFLEKPTDQQDIEQRLPAVLDGYHWSDQTVRAGGRFLSRSQTGVTETLKAADFAEVREDGSSLEVTVPTTQGGTLRFIFEERALTIRAEGLGPGTTFALDFQWVPGLSALRQVTPKRLHYQHDGFDYSVKVQQGRAEQTARGVRIDADAKGIKIELAQSA
jgi:hypothetical protein